MNNENQTKEIRSEKNDINSPTTRTRLENNIDKKRSLEEARSKVRIIVTYIMAGVYALSAPSMVAWLLYQDKIESAIAVFSGIASTATSIIAFWFGTRQPQRSTRVAEEG